MSILITGSSGFLGNALYENLKKKGILAKKISRKNIKGSIQVSNYKNIPKADTLIHLAQSNDREFVNSQDGRYAEENIDLVSYLTRKKYNKFIYISSASVYGDKFKKPRKTSDIIDAYDLYSEIKIESEKKVIESEGIILRLSNIYGPKMSQKNVLSKIINQVINNDLIHLKNGSAIRDFIWVEDVTRAIIKTIESDIKSSILNIGSGKGHSIKELIDNVQSAYGKNLPIKFDENDNSFSSLVLDINETVNKLQWRPEINIKEGIHYIMKSKT